jgi:hypothetical protein
MEQVSSERGMIIEARRQELCGGDTSEEDREEQRERAGWADVE